jgi:hypothetical protein
MVVFAQLIEMQGGCVVEVTAIGGDVDAQLKGSHQTHG